MNIDRKKKTIFYKGVEVSIQKVFELIEECITEERKVKIEDVLSKRSEFFAPVMEGLYDRGNISAVMRSAEAFGFYKFHIIETLDKFKESSRVSQGADKWLDVEKWSSTKKCISKLKSEGYKVYTTHLSADAKPFDELDFKEKTAVIFGNEKDGVTKEALDMSDGNVVLPMAGFTQSFNISVAGALSFQRAFLKKPQTIDDEERQMLKALYYLRTADWPMEVLSKKFKG